MPTDSIANQVQAFAEAGGIIYSLSEQAQGELNDYLGAYRPSASKRRLHVLRLPRLMREITAQPDLYTYHVAILEEQIVSVMISSYQPPSTSTIFLVPPPATIHLDALASFQEGTGAATALVSMLAQGGLRIILYALPHSVSFYRGLGGMGSHRNRHSYNIGQNFHIFADENDTLAAASRPHFSTPLPILDTLAGLTIANFPSRAMPTPGVHSQPDVIGTPDLF